MICLLLPPNIQRWKSEGVFNLFCFASSIETTSSKLPGGSEL